VIRSQVKVFQQFPKITERVDRAAAAAVDAAAVEAAAVANREAFIPLELDLITAHEDAEGYSAGIKSQKRGRASSVRIARFFDEGTLGGRKKALKQPRKQSWTVDRGDSAYTARRSQDLAGKGIEAQHFFAAARTAGRKKLLETIRRGI
jgi:hypothetical protein